MNNSIHKKVDGIVSYTCHVSLFVLDFFCIVDLRQYLQTDGFIRTNEQLETFSLEII